MARILFVVPPFYGHIMPTLGIGGILIERGHTLCWTSLKKIAPELVPAGGICLVPEEVRSQSDKIDQILTQQNIGTKISGFDALDFGLEDTMLPFARIQSQGMQSVINEFNPDCIIHDESALAGAIAAYNNGIPYATSITPPPGFFEPNLFYPERQQELRERIKQFQSEMGIDSEDVIFNSSILVLSYTSRDVLFPHYGNFEFQAPIHFVGASVSGRPEAFSFDWERIENSEWPIVYVSIGTVLDDVRSSIFEKVIQAFGCKPLTIVANTDPSIFDVWPDNFIVQKRCPQLKILERAEVVVTHGGFNTVNESLFFGKPMIVIPLAWDQFSNADLVAKSGCGMKFKFRRLKPEFLYRAVFKILEEHSSYKGHAVRLGNSLRALGGSERAADLIESIIT